MALTDDQKAMLRLLAQREEGYEEMASMMGIPVEELRKRVKDALAEVDRPGPAVGRPPRRPVRRPTLPSPIARLNASKNRGALIGIGAGALALVALVVVLIAGGGEDSSSSSTTGSSQSGTSLTAAEEENLTQAVLSPTDGSDASGKALFGRYKKEILLQVEANGLEPSPAGQSYTIWLYKSPEVVLRVGATNVTAADEGKLAVQLPIPTEVLSYIAGGAFDQVDISLTSNAAYAAELAKAKKSQTLPPYTGESVLRGKITGPAIR